MSKNCPPLTNGRTYNFSAGPCTLPEPVMLKAQEELLNYQGKGFGVMEMSHRSKEFIAIATKAEKDLRDLMKIPDNYKVLFVQGGGFGQFSAVPLNILGDADTADYIETGNWSSNAIKEGKKYVKNLKVIASNKTANGEFPNIPATSTWKFTPGAKYVHYCDNETVHGVEFPAVPEVPEGTILVCDMSSNILSKPVDVTKFGVIYAGAQKNLGPAGLTVVIVRDDLLEKAHPLCPTVMDYTVLAKADSMKNTPPCFSWYMAGLNFQWVKDQGGLEEMERRHKYMADKLYNYIDSSDYYKCFVEKEFRSRINIPFTFAVSDPEKEKVFLKEASEIGLDNLKGYRTMGGFRASMYNGLPTQAVDCLVKFMDDFAKKNPVA